MATRRESMPGKEKRGTSPMGTTTQKPRGRSPTTKSTSPASEKHVPNYLKPTISSSSSTDSKPQHTRRPSFEKSPSPSRTQKTRVSPSPSASFSRKTVSPQKSAPPEKNVRVKDAGKQHSLYARPVASAVKKSAKKQERGNRTAATKDEIITDVQHEVVENPDTSIVPEPEMNPDYQESSDTKAEKQTELDGNETEDENKEGTEDLVEEDHQEPIEVEQIEVEIDDKDAKIVNTESNASDDINTDEKEENLQTKDTSSEPKELEEHPEKEKEIKLEDTNEKRGSGIDKSVVEKPNEEVREKTADEDEIEIELNKIEEKEASESEVHDSKETELVEEKKTEADRIEAHESEETEVMEEKKQQGNETEAQDCKETEVIQENLHEAKSEEIKQQIAHGKKDCAVSNDSIEETAIKLREQRKNKVKALAGAFESVMQ